MFNFENINESRNPEDIIYLMPMKLIVKTKKNYCFQETLDLDWSQ